MSAWKEQRGADGSYQAVPVRAAARSHRTLERDPETGVRKWRNHTLPEPTAPVADIPAAKPFFTPWLSFAVGVFVGASLMAGALVIGLQHLSALPH